MIFGHNRHELSARENWEENFILYLVYGQSNVTSGLNGLCLARDKNPNTNRHELIEDREAMGISLVSLWGLLSGKILLNTEYTKGFYCTAAMDNFTPTGNYCAAAMDNFTPFVLFLFLDLINS
jgi:hypothetical protein